jgi:hypothetical protein
LFCPKQTKREKQCHAQQQTRQEAGSPDRFLLGGGHFVQILHNLGAKEIFPPVACYILLRHLCDRLMKTGLEPHNYCASPACMRNYGACCKPMVMADNLYDNQISGSFSRRTHDKEENMDILQKIIISAAVIFVVGGVIWFIFIAH